MVSSGGGRSRGRIRSERFSLPEGLLRIISLVLIIGILPCAVANQPCLLEIPASSADLPSPTYITEQSNTSFLTVCVSLLCPNVTNNATDIGYSLSVQQLGVPGQMIQPRFSLVFNSTVTVPNVAASSEYFISIQWIINGSQMLQSAPLTVTIPANDLLAPSSPPVDVMITEVTTQTLMLSYFPPLRPNSPIVRYRITGLNTVNASLGIAFTTTSLSTRVVALQPNTTYRITVGAVNEAGNNASGANATLSPLSTPIEVTTRAQAVQDQEPLLIFFFTGGLSVTPSNTLLHHVTGGFSAPPAPYIYTAWNYFYNAFHVTVPVHYIYVAALDSVSMLSEIRILITAFDTMGLSCLSCNRPPLVANISGEVDALDVDWISQRMFFGIWSPSTGVSQVRSVDFISPQFFNAGPDSAFVMNISSRITDIGVDPIHGFVYLLANGSSGLLRVDLQDNETLMAVLEDFVITSFQLDLENSRLLFVSNFTIWVYPFGAVTIAPRRLFPTITNVREFAEYSNFLAWFHSNNDDSTSIGDTSGGTDLVNLETTQLGGGVNASRLRLFRAGLQPRPVAEVPIRDLEVLVTATGARLRWLPPSTAGFGTGSFQEWSYRVTAAPQGSTMAVDVCYVMAYNGITSPEQAVTLDLTDALAPSTRYTFTVNPFDSVLVGDAVACNGAVDGRFGPGASFVAETLAATTVEPTLLLTDSQSLRYSSVDGRLGDTLTTTMGSPVGISYDLSNASLIWASETGSGQFSLYHQYNDLVSIVAANQSNLLPTFLNTSTVPDPVALASFDFNSILPSGGLRLAVDYIGKRVFWSTGSRVNFVHYNQPSMVYSLQSSISAVPDLVDLTLDVVRGYVYWITANQFNVGRVNTNFCQFRRGQFFSSLSPGVPRGEFLRAVYYYAALDRLYFSVQVGTQTEVRYGTPQPSQGLLTSIVTVYTGALNNGPITAFSNKVFIRGNNLTTVSVIDVALSSAAPPYFVSFQPENASPSPLNAITVMAVDSQPLGAAACFANLPGDARPPAPANLRVDMARTTPTELVLVWDESPALCAGESIVYNLDFTTAAHGTNAPVLAAMACPIQLSNSSYSISGLRPATRVNVTRLQAFSTWLPSSVVMDSFSTAEIAPAQSPANPRLFFTCTANVCQASLRWDEIPVASQNGNITSYDVRWGPLGQIMTSTVTNRTFSATDLAAGQNYTFEVRGVNSASPGPFTIAVVSFFAPNGGVFVPELLLASGPNPQPISVFDVDSGMVASTPLVAMENIINAANPSQYFVQFIKFSARTGETFWVAALSGIIWNLRYQSNTGQVCTLRTSAVNTGAADRRAVSGLEFDWIGRILYLADEANGVFTMRQLVLPPGSVCGGQMTEEVLRTSSLPLHSLSLLPVQGELYFVQGLGVDLETVASPAATMPSAVRRRRKRQAVDATIVRTFNSSALHFSAVDNRLYLAVISGGASIFICPNPTAMGGCNRFEPSIPSSFSISDIYSDTTFLYWTTTQDSSIVFYQRLDALPSTVGIMTLSKAPNAPVISFGQQLQPVPPLDCLVPSNDTIAAPQPAVVNPTSAVLNITAPVLTAQCRQLTSSLAPSMVVLGQALAGSNVLQRVIVSDSYSIIVRDLMPVMSYDFTVLAFENIFGRTNITNGAKLTITTPEFRPSEPRGIRVSVVGPDAVEANWTEPANPNGVITGYRILAVDVAASGDMVSASVDARTRQTILVGLSPGVSYMLSVFAANSAGEGNASQAVNFTMFTSPPALNVTMVTTGAAVVSCPGVANATCAGVQLTCVSRPNCTNTACAGSSSIQGVAIAGGNTFSLTGLEGLVNYNITARYAYPRYTFSAVSPDLLTSAATVPDAPLDFGSDISAGNFLFSWLKPLCRRDSNTTSYELDVTLVGGLITTERNFIVMDAGDRLQFSIPQNTEYASVVLVAINSIGRSRPSTSDPVGRFNMSTGDDPSLGLIIGVACGGGLLILALLLTTAVCVRSKRKRRREPIGGFDIGAYTRNNQEYRPVVIDEELRQYEIKADQVRVDEQIGKGHFGVVKRGYYKIKPDSEEVQVAIKTLNANAPREGEDEFMEEAKIMLDMNHAHILRCFGICVHESLWLVMEYCQGGNLLTFLEACKHQMDDGIVLSVLDVVNMMEDIARGMVYLEEQHKVHRDLAARNILIANDPRSPGRKLKISDFGLTRDNYTEEYIMDLSARDKALPIRWVAPESMIYGVFNSKTDVWAYGIVCWELGSLGDLPYGSFRDVRNIIDEVKRGLKIRRPPYFTDEMYNIMRSAMHYRPERRASFAQVLTMTEQYKSSIRDCMNLDVFMMQRYNHNPMAPDEYFTAEETGEYELQATAAAASSISRAESLRNSIKRLRTSLRGRNDVQGGGEDGEDATMLTNLTREARMSGKRGDNSSNQYVGEIKPFEGEDLKSGAGLRVNMSATNANGGANARLSMPASTAHYLQPTSSDASYSHPRPSPGSSFSSPAEMGQRAAPPAGQASKQLQSEVPVNYNWPSNEPKSSTYSDPRPAAGSSKTEGSVVGKTALNGRLQSEVPANYNWPSSQPQSTGYTNALAGAAMAAGRGKPTGSPAVAAKPRMQSEVPVNYNWPSSQPAAAAGSGREHHAPLVQDQYQHPRSNTDLDAAQRQQIRQHRAAAARTASGDSVDVVPAAWMTNEDLQRTSSDPPAARPRAATRPVPGQESPAPKPRASPRATPRSQATREPSVEQTAAANAEYSNKFISGVRKKEKTKPPPPVRHDTLPDSMGGNNAVQLTSMRRLGSSSGGVANGSAQNGGHTFTNNRAVESVSSVGDMESVEFEEQV